MAPHDTLSVLTAQGKSISEFRSPRASLPPTLLGTEQALHLRYIMRLTFIMESYAKLITVWADIIPERCAELILRYNIPPEQFLYDTLLPCIIEYYLELFTFSNRPVCTAEELAYGRGALQEVWQLLRLWKVALFFKSSLSERSEFGLLENAFSRFSAA